MALVTALMLFKCQCRIQLFFSKRDLFLFVVQSAQLSALFSCPGSCRSWGCQHTETRVEKVGENCGTCMGRTHHFISCIVALTAIVCYHKNFLSYNNHVWPSQHSTVNTTKKPREFPEMLVEALHVSVSGEKYSTCQTHLFSLLVINMSWKIGYDYYLIFPDSKVKSGC